MREIAGYTEGAIPVPERRVHARQRVPLAYIDLGGGNGGIVTNVSEGGVAVTAVEPLVEKHLPKIRFELPGSSKRIEAGGQIAWLGESRKEAGIRFAAVSGEATAEIKNWLATEIVSACAIEFPSEQPAAEKKIHKPGPLNPASEPTLRPASIEDTSDTASAAVLASGTALERLSQAPTRRPFSAMMAPEMLAVEPAVIELRAPEPLPEPAPPLRTVRAVHPGGSAAAVAPATESPTVPVGEAPPMPVDSSAAEPHGEIAEANKLPPGDHDSAEAQATATEIEASAAAESPTAAATTTNSPPVSEFIAGEAEIPAVQPGESAAPVSDDVTDIAFEAAERTQVAQEFEPEAPVPGKSFAAALQNTRLPSASWPGPAINLGPPDDGNAFQYVSAASAGGEHERPRRSWWALTALISLFAVISFVAGMAAGGGGWDGVLRLVSGGSSQADEPARATEPAAVSSLDPAGAGKAIAAPVAENAGTKQPPTKPTGHDVPAANASPNSDRGGGGDGSTYALNLPESSVSASSSIAITSRRSVVVTQESAPKSASQGADVQIGMLFYRVEPFYPADAEKQGIEGTVEVHAIVGRNGMVRSAEAISGPAILSDAAVKAVREWKYKPTTVNGQELESEVNVKMVFRLPQR